VPYMLRTALGYMLILIGVASSPVPLFPSVIFLGMGLVILSNDVPLFARIVCRLGNRFPPVRTSLVRIHAFLSRYGFTPLSCPYDE
jgi:hypothetical protein